MNFFGHAAVAARFDERPGFLLGAMLPDFCGMLRLRPPAVACPNVGAGVRFHHQTDAVFHDLSLFRSWCQKARVHLEARGVARGTARAVAHVGLELLLDAALAEAEAARSAYLNGLDAGRDPRILDEMAWPAEPRAKLSDLASLLSARGVGAKVPATVVADRLSRALAARPRLAIRASDRPAVDEWVEVFGEHVVAFTPALLAELVGELERQRTT
jgi:hypothetical protein